ncbi:hypothetical protein OG453_01630 [Streptomyces sp. NBC_01381]|uniref:hypothetical protein n=1 Tax=Streptomyces sp. NBC_01381 TaxID=2903845 RepID=UPI00225671BA|nr:hypothetical protein [Streptomyces sp. NBC_01381]MCX4665383.1 hypothetical protein [Streptomyces sp. NBC_01381]
MPTPYGSRGGMAFSAEELRVLRRALALALHPSPVSDEDVQDCLRLADSVDEAAREGARLRAFMLADLARYRAALPGTATGYLALLEDVIGSGHQPGADDLAALRALRGNPVAAALLERCRALAERDVRARLSGRAAVQTKAAPRPRIPASRTRLLALPGGRGDAERPEAPKPKSPATPARRPAAPEPGRPVPTPAEVFPPKRRPADPADPAAPANPADPAHRLVAG